MNGGRGEVSILSHRPLTSSDLKQNRLFFRESVSTFLQLVVALGVSWELPVLYCKKPNIQQACLLLAFLLLGA